MHEPNADAWTLADIQQALAAIQQALAEDIGACQAEGWYEALGALIVPITDMCINMTYRYDGN